MALLLRSKSGIAISDAEDRGVEPGRPLVAAGDIEVRDAPRALERQRVACPRRPRPGGEHLRRAVGGLGGQLGGIAGRGRTRRGLGELVGRERDRLLHQAGEQRQAAREIEARAQPLRVHPRRLGLELRQVRFGRVALADARAVIACSRVSSPSRLLSSARSHSRLRSAST